MFFIFSKQENRNNVWLQEINIKKENKYVYQIFSSVNINFLMFSKNLL